MPGSAGTNWWKAVFGQGFVGDYNLNVSGGGDDNAYGVSFNYFDVKGTAAYNHFKRGSVRANTAVHPRPAQLRREHCRRRRAVDYGGLPNDPEGYAEDGILGKNILMQPVIPVYDIQGNFASGKVSGLGNQTQSAQVRGRAQGQHGIERPGVRQSSSPRSTSMTTVTVRSRLGFNCRPGIVPGVQPDPPRKLRAELHELDQREHQPVHRLDVEQHRDLQPAPSGTGTTFSLLAGQEASAARNRFTAAGMSNLISTDPDSRYIQDALGDAASKNVTSTGGRSALLSFFGKADYNFDEKYVASFTVRKDGSSRLGPTHRWGTFPAVGLGWRLSKEPFMSGNKLFSDVMLRRAGASPGTRRSPPAASCRSTVATRGDTYYDVTGANGSVVSGFRQTSLGNTDLKWEENKSTNIGADVGLLDGKLNVVIDLYQRATEQPALRSADARNRGHRRAADRQHRRDEEHGHRSLDRLPGSSLVGDAERQPLQERDRLDRRRSGLLLRSDLDAVRQPGHQPGRPSHRFVLRLGRRRVCSGMPPT